MRVGPDPNAIWAGLLQNLSVMFLNRQCKEQVEIGPIPPRTEIAGEGRRRTEQMEGEKVRSELCYSLQLPSTVDNLILFIQGHMGR